MVKLAIQQSLTELTWMVIPVWVEHWIWSMVTKRSLRNSPLPKCFLSHCANTLEDKSELLEVSHRGVSTSLNQRNEEKKT